MTQVTEFKGPIVEGAWYERDNGSVGRCGAFNAGFGHVLDDPYRRYSGERVYKKTPRLTRRVYVTPADPAEVVAELQRMAHICSASAESSGSRAFDTAADLVAEKLGVKL